MNVVIFTVQIIRSCGPHVVYCAYLDDEFYHLDLTHLKLTGNTTKVKPRKVTTMPIMTYTITFNCIE